MGQDLYLCLINQIENYDYNAIFFILLILDTSSCYKYNIV